MAFNFNWSPLIADTSRARDMLTTALNKSPKPPIIVDDIIVTELNLGSVPPELEILEIGDLAEDRFRGIFKMSYTGDAYLTLKTRVQANPLNTYLTTKPSFASPQPLAASSGLTIPLQLTLSDIRLSGFVILVFSRQKGLTLVFRNDPLESLKVSSTFDSIPFVRDYLQKEIEGQLRVLFMDDLPAILHRLSLQLWSPDHAPSTDEASNQPSDTAKTDEQPIDPLASPPLDACDAFGRRLDDTELSTLSLDNATETHATFSQKNLLRLATLNDSHRTLALFTPTIRDAVFRAWAGAAERGDNTGTVTPLMVYSSSSRHHSPMSSVASSIYSFSDGAAIPSTRPSTLSSLHSSHNSAIGSLSSRSRGHAGRRRRHRVVDLRTPTATASEASSQPSTRTPSLSSQGATADQSEEREGELVTPPTSPRQTNSKVRILEEPTEIYSPRPRTIPSNRLANIAEISISHDNNSAITSTTSSHTQPVPTTTATRPPLPQKHLRDSRPQIPQLHLRFSEKHGHGHHLDNFAPLRFAPGPATPSTLTSYSPATTGGILEQAWMMKMANEIAMKVKCEKDAAAAAAAEAQAEGFWGAGRIAGGVGLEVGDESPPPAYAA